MADRPATTRPLDRVFDALRTQDRRRVLHVLSAAESDDGRAVTLRDTMPPGNDEATYLTRMRHTDVPKLVDYGYVEYDDESDVLRPGSRFDEIERVIETLFENEEHLPGEFP